METRANYTMVGAFVVFFLIAMVTFVLWVTRSDFSRNTAEYNIYFSRSVTGLKEGGTVLYRGVPIGAVKSIALDPKNVERIKVTILVKGKVPIKEDAFASLETQGITGVAYIQLSGGTSQAPLLQPKPGKYRAVIQTRSSVFEEVTSSLPAVLQQISKTFEEIRPLFNDENRQAFGESLKNIHTITKALAPVPGKDNDIHDLMVSMKEGVKEIRFLLAEMKSLIKDNRGGIHEFTHTGLPALTQFLTEGKEALSTIRRVGESIERSPSRFIYHDSREGVKVP